MIVFFFKQQRERNSKIFKIDKTMITRIKFIHLYDNISIVSTYTKKSILPDMRRGYQIFLTIKSLHDRKLMNIENSDD